MHPCDLKRLTFFRVVSFLLSMPLFLWKEALEFLFAPRAVIFFLFFFKNLFQLFPPPPLNDERFLLPTAPELASPDPLESSPKRLLIDLFADMSFLE